MSERALPVPFDYSSESKDRLAPHMRYACVHCGKPFSTAFNHQRHMKTQHGFDADDEKESGDGTSEVDDGETTTDHSDVTSSADDEKSTTDAEDDSETATNNTDEMEIDDDDDDQESMNTFSELLKWKIDDIYDSLKDERLRLWQKYKAKGMEDKHAMECVNYAIKPKLKKRFKEGITNLLILAEGMEESPRYVRLFQKVRKYRDNCMAFADAIHLAVTREQWILDKDVDRYLKRMKHGKSSVDGNDLNSGADTESDDSEDTE